MTRRTLTVLIALLTGAAVLVTASTDALAKGKKKKAKDTTPPEATEPPASEAIASQVGDIQWGMSPDEVIAAVSEQIKAEYQEKAKAITDSIKEDKLFQQRDKAIEKVKKSYIEFKGQPTGWDSSVVKKEYTHKNGESMIVVEHDKWDDYYFFIDNPDYNPAAGSGASSWDENKVVLWKLYRSFDAGMFPGLQWESVQEIMIGQFGAMPFKVKQFDKDTKFVKVVGLQWQDDQTLLTLVNQFTFFGIFCLSFEAKHIQKRIDELRVNKPPSDDEGHAIVDNLSEGTGSDSDSNIVDILAGKSHGAQNSPVTGQGGKK